MQHHFDAAEAEVNNALKEDPNNLYARAYKEKIYTLRHEYEEARRRAEQEAVIKAELEEKLHQQKALEIPPAPKTQVTPPQQPTTQKNIDRLKEQLYEALHDGVFSAEEKSTLEKERHRLNIPQHQFEQLEHEIKLLCYVEAVRSSIRNGTISPLRPHALETLRTKFGVSAEEHLAIEGRIFWELQHKPHHATVLLIDDNDDFLSVISQGLTDHGYSVIGANSPENALEKLTSAEADLIVCDIGFDLFYLGNDPFGLIGEQNFSLPIGTLAALAVGGGMSLWGLQSGAKAVLASTAAVPVPENDPRYRMLTNVVDEMTIASGLPRPKIFVIPDDDPNAFATGKDPEHSYIAVTQGLVDTLNREELQGVVAHEMSHVKNYDIRVMTVIAALVGAVFLLSDWASRAMRLGMGGGKGSRDSRGSVGGLLALILLVLWIVAIMLAPFISQILAMAVSRQREYLADASGAELTRNPLGLASALEKIESAESPTQSIKRGSAHLCIVDPLGRKANLKEGTIADIFATHPPIGKRVTLLKAMAYQVRPANLSA